MVKFNNVTAIYKNGAGIFNVDFEINKSEMIFLMGPTGSGKSTLLKTIYKELDIEPIEDQIRNLNENVLQVKECKDIDIIINNILKDDHCISETQLALKRNNIFNWGSSSDMSADYIVNYLEKTE